jgi:hypothetical protein
MLSLPIRLYEVHFIRVFALAQRAAIHASVGEVCVIGNVHLGLDLAHMRSSLGAMCRLR